MSRALPLSVFLPMTIIFRPLLSVNTTVYSIQMNVPSEVISGLYIGSVGSLKGNVAFDGVVTVMKEPPKCVRQGDNIKQLFINVNDTPNDDISCHVDIACDFIEDITSTGGKGKYKTVPRTRESYKS